jgi:hypothetical protein
MTMTTSFESDNGRDVDECCREIEGWPIHTFADVERLLEFVADCWNTDYGTVMQELVPCEASLVHSEEGDRFYRFATGGWSENEELIGALNQNNLARAFAWCLSARGGLHIYRYRKE